MVIDAPATFVNWDRDGRHVYKIDGSASHTHGFACSLVDFRWYHNDELLLYYEILRVRLGTRKPTPQLQIFYDVGDALL